MTGDGMGSGVRALPFLVGVLIIIALALLGVLSYVAYVVNSSLSNIQTAVCSKGSASRGTETQAGAANVSTQGDLSTVTARAIDFSSVPSFTAHTPRVDDVFSAEPTPRGLAEKMRVYDEMARSPSFGLDAAAGRHSARNELQEDVSRPLSNGEHGLEAGLSGKKSQETQPRTALDATVLGSTLYVLDEHGNVSAKSLLTSKQARARVCRIERPPAPLVSIDAVRGEIVGRTRNGQVLVLEPCPDPTCSHDRRPECEGSVARWKPPTIAGHGVRGVDGDGEGAEDVDLANVKHISTSPDGRRLWVQDGEYGRLFEIDEDGAWVPVGKAQRTGNESVSRVIGPNGDFVDLLNGNAVRNTDIRTKRSGVENVVYPGGREYGSRPLYTERGRKRVSEGVVAKFPCSVDDLAEICSASVSNK